MRFELSVACSILILFLDDDICLGELRITIYAVVCYICACMSSKKLCIYIYIYDICFSPMILQQNVIYIYMIFVFHLRFSSKKFCIYIYMIFVFHLWFSSKKLYIYIFIFIYDICFSPMILQQKVIYIYIYIYMIFVFHLWFCHYLHLNISETFGVTEQQVLWLKKDAFPLSTNRFKCKTIQ